MDSRTAMREAQRWSNARAVFLGMALSLSGSLVAQQPPPPVISVDNGGVSVTGVTKAGSVVVFGVARRTAGYFEKRESRAEVVSDQDSDGAVRYDVPKGLPWRSVWFVVDLTSGQYAFTAPEGFPLEEVAFPGRGIGNELKSLETAGDFVELLWVRPGTTGGAAWTQAVGDGGAHDEDAHGGDHRVRADVSRFQAVGQAPAPPEKFAPGDVLVGVEASTLVVFASRLAN